MGTYIDWGMGGVVAAIVIWLFIAWIADRIIDSWYNRVEKRVVMEKVNKFCMFILLPSIVGVALWRGPLITKEEAHQEQMRWVAYFASLPQERVVVIGTELAVGSYLRDRNFVEPEVYGIHVMTEEFPTQKILIRKSHGVMDLRKGEKLLLWLDGWEAMKVVRCKAVPDENE